MENEEVTKRSEVHDAGINKEVNNETGQMKAEASQSKDSTGVAQNMFGYSGDKELILS